MLWVLNEPSQCILKQMDSRPFRVRILARILAKCELKKQLGGGIFSTCIFS